MYRVEWEFPDGSFGVEYFETWEAADAAAMQCHPSCRVWLISEADAEAGYTLEPLSEIFR